MLILFIFMGFVTACLLELKDMYLATYEVEDDNYYYYEDYDEEDYVLDGKYIYAS